MENGIHEKGKGFWFQVPFDVEGKFVGSVVIPDGTDQDEVEAVPGESIPMGGFDPPGTPQPVVAVTDGPGQDMPAKGGIGGVKVEAEPNAEGVYLMPTATIVRLDTRKMIEGKAQA